MHKSKFLLLYVNFILSYGFWNSYETNQVIEDKFEEYMPKNDVNSSYFSSNRTEFRIAVVTSGAIRSFAYVEKSWRRYMIDPWKRNIHIFAHVLVSKGCILSHKGLESLKGISTEIEVGYSSTPLIPNRVVIKKLPEKLRRSEYFKSQSKGMARGNFFDMHIRRIRAYEMARGYAERKGFEWDLIVLVRLDTAFYDPVLAFGKIYFGLKNFMEKTRKAAIYIPTPCNFQGTCDRLAFGLPREMEMYFQHDWPFEVLKWAVSPTEKSPDINVNEMQRIKDMMAENGNSEHILKCLFVMNNLTQVYSNRIQRILAFVTLRTSTADGYCSMTRNDYLYRHPSWTKFIWEPDKMTAYPDHSSPYEGFDLVADPVERCGAIHSLNATIICATRECNCGKYG